MIIADKDYIINTVFRTNILPVISECNTSCVFCSHKQNPDGIEIFKIPRLTIDDFRDIIGFLSPNKKIVIGEAATRIIEGEPLLHPGLIEIISLVRDRFKLTPIQITTNGILLSRELIDRFVSIGNIELNISVNSIDIINRRRILGLKKDSDIREKLKMLSGKLKFSGSCVLVPGLLEWEEVEEMVGLLQENQAETVRIFLPGFTSISESKMDFYQIHREASEFAEKLRQKYEIPVVIEPAVITDLDCKIEGVIRRTPAYDAGLKTGDVILEVNGDAVKTRVDAFNAAYKYSNPVLTILRGEESLDLRLKKQKNKSPGFIVLFDIGSEAISEVNSLVDRYQAQNVMIVTSELASAIIKRLFEKSDFKFRYNIVTSKNSFFGGTIKCAGLLTMQDIIECTEEYLSHGNKPDLIILPSIMFDFKRRDLTGRSISEIEKIFGINVDIV